MTALKALSPIGAIVGLCLGALVVLELLVSQGATRFVVPSPDATGEEMLRAMHARRFQAAHRELAVAARAQVGEAGLRMLADQLEAGGRGILDAHGQGSAEQGERATAQLLVKTSDGQERPLELPLVKEQGEWKVASLEPLQAMVPQARP